MSLFRVATLTLLLSSAALVGCGDDAAEDPSGGGQAPGGMGGTGGTVAPGGAGGLGGGGGMGGMLPFEVTSTAFAEGDAIPLAQECGPPLQGPGMNQSPPLTWTPGPAGTMSYAVVVRDVDAMIAQYPEGVIHWVIYDIPVDALGLAEGIADGYQVAAPAGAKQANIQDSGFFGYFGMCSPNATNTYVFTVHAMPEATVPGVTMQSTESDVAAAVEATSIAQASLSGES